MTFHAGQSVRFCGEIVKIASVHHHRHGTRYICEFPDGSFAPANQDALQPVEIMEEFEKELPTTFFQREGQAKNRTLK